MTDPETSQVGQVVFASSDIDPTPLAQTLMREWAEVTIARIPIDDLDPLAGWRWRIVGNYRKT